MIKKGFLHPSHCFVISIDSGVSFFIPDPASSLLKQRNTIYLLFFYFRTYRCVHAWIVK